MYKTFCTSVIGASHIRQNIPKEDYGIKVDNDEYNIFVTADGHGAEECFRSKDGSRLVCQVASAELQQFYKFVKDNNLVDELLSQNNKTQQLIYHLMQHIVYKWNNAINEDYTTNPPTEKEKTVEPSRLEKAYGTTLIAGLITKNYSLLLQQGDGHCVAFDTTGAPFQPIPEDPNCVGNVTTSMCDLDVMNRYRYAIIDTKSKPLLAIFAGSDGVEDCYGASMQKTTNYYQQLIVKLHDNGIENFEPYLEKTLPINSQHGSADDITITGCVDMDVLNKTYTLFSGIFDKTQQLIHQQALLKKATEKLGSMQRKLKFYKETRDSLDKEYEELKVLRDKAIAKNKNYKELYDLFAEKLANANLFSAMHYKSIIHELDGQANDISLELNTLEHRLVETKDKLALATKNYDEYLEIYLTYEKMRDDAMHEIELINNNVTDANNAEIKMEDEVNEEMFSNDDTLELAHIAKDNATILEDVVEDPLGNAMPSISDNGLASETVDNNNNSNEKSSNSIISNDSVDVTPKDDIGSSSKGKKEN